jgi:hypothetical protein
MLIIWAGHGVHLIGRTGHMPERVDQYRQNAEKCFETAKTFNDPEARRTMFAMADAWTMLAVQRVKTLAAAEPSPPRSQASSSDNAG